MLVCQPQSDFLLNNGYQLVLPRFPDVQYYSTDFMLPQVALPQSTFSSPFTDIQIPGDKPIFSPYSFSFMVTDDLSNYKTIFDWISSIGFAQGYDQFKDYGNRTPKHETLGQQESKVVFFSGKGNATSVITFHDSFPIALSGLDMTSQDPTTNYVKATVTMAYTYYTIGEA